MESDFYGFRFDDKIGSWIITKNGEYFLTVLGGEKAAKNMANMLNDDVQRVRNEK